MEPDENGLLKTTEMATALVPSLPDRDRHRSANAIAQRALAEARVRREHAKLLEPPTEHDGRGGLDPVRYGDWEVKGLTSDF